MTTQSFPASFVDQDLGAVLQEPEGSVSITMKTYKVYTDGTPLTTGNTYSVTASWGKLAVESGWASVAPSDSFPETPRISTLDSSEVESVRAVIGSPFIADGVALYAATTTASATCTIGDASAAFVSTDVGKICVVIPYTDTGLTPRWGTITAVATNGLSCTASLSASPGALTGATFIYGTDNGAAINAALSDASTNGGTAVTLPWGIVCSSLQHIVPTGVILQGQGNQSNGGKAKDFRHYASSFVLCKAYGSGGFVTLGTAGTTDPRGCGLCDLNIDCMNLSVNCVSGDGGRTAHVRNVTLLRGTAETYKGGPTTNIHDCCIIGQNNGNVVQLSGDSRCVNNNITGAGNGFYGIKGSNLDDGLIALNHIWKDSAASSMLGGSIWLSQNSSNVKAGSVLVTGNKLDTNYGSAIKLTVSGSSTARGWQIVGNVAFNNDAVTNNTGPVIEINVASGCAIRGLVIQGNNARGSWNDPTKGQWTYLIDNSATAGNIYGSSVGGNVADNCNGLFNSFTPDHDNGNISIAGTGTVLTKSTTT